MKGIGDSSGKKILELLNTGKLDALEKMQAITPSGVLEMMSVKGLGPKKIAVIWKELGLESIGELEYACLENRLATLKGFGAKTQQAVLDQLEFRKASQGLHLYAGVEGLAFQLIDKLRSALPAYQWAFTGAFRRQSEVMAQIDLLTTSTIEELVKLFEAVPDTVIEEDPNQHITVRIPQHPMLRFHLCEPATFAGTLFLTTGSEEFISGFPSPLKALQDYATEEQVFQDAGLPFVPAPLRESTDVLTRTIPGKLLSDSDIRGIIHSHSTWSDGRDSIGDMAMAAAEQGYEYLVITDHSRTAAYARGLTAERVFQQHEEIDLLNQRLSEFRIFKGIESDILGDGSLDYEEEVLRKFDLVIASVHSGFKMSEEKATGRLIRAIENPYTTMLGHPTGRLLLSRNGYPIDHRKVIDACAANRVVIEINANPRRLDLDWRWIPYALDKGVILSVNPDAHSIAGFRDIHFGVLAAQKGALTADRNLSSLSRVQLEQFLSTRRPLTAV